MPKPTSHISFVCTTHIHISFHLLCTYTHFAFCTLSIFNMFVFDLTLVLCMHVCCICTYIFCFVYFYIFHPCFLYFVFCFLFLCVFLFLLVLLLSRQISPWGLIKYISIYLSIYNIYYSSDSSTITRMTITAVALKINTKTL